MSQKEHGLSGPFALALNPCWERSFYSGWAFAATGSQALL